MKVYKVKIILALILLAASNVLLFAQQQLDCTIFYDGNEREYTLYIPEIYSEDTPAPLIFNFHGGGGDIESQIYVSDMRPLSDDHGFLLVYPQALPDPNDGGSTNWMHKEPTDVDDIYFVEAMIDALADEYNVNEDRVYGCGYSLGGEFTFDLGCRLNDRIAAIGVVARTMQTNTYNNCSPVHPTAVLTILGTDDAISPYEGFWWGGEQYYTSADELNEYWTNFNNTDQYPTITPLPDIAPNDGSTVELHQWNNGDNDVSVYHFKVIGGGHDWPGTFGNMDIIANDEIWNFVSQFDVNGLIYTSADEMEIVPNNNFKLSNFPNPFNPTTNINFSLTKAEHIKLEIFDIKGKKIRTLFDGELAARSHNVLWDGKDDNNSTVSSGMYFYQIQTATEFSSRKMILIK